MKAVESAAPFDGMNPITIEASKRACPVRFEASARNEGHRIRGTP